jgi:hypothetical protein
MLALQQDDGLGRPVEVGNDDGRVENTPVKVVRNKDVAREDLERATAFYEADARILQRFDGKIRALPRPFAGFRRKPLTVLRKALSRPGPLMKTVFKTVVLRFFYVAIAEWKTERLRFADLSWLSSSQMVTLVHWYLNTQGISASMYDPRLCFSYLWQQKTKAWHAHECTAYLVLHHCYRGSKEPHWRQAYYHYLNARALHACGFSIAMISRSIDAALRSAEQWESEDDNAETFRAANNCFNTKLDVARLYWHLAERDWSAPKELFELARKTFREAQDLAVRFPAIGDE